MSLSQMDTQCTAEKDAIRRLLNSNEMTMTQVVKDRVDVLRAYQAANPGPVILKGQVVEVDKMPKFREGWDGFLKHSLFKMEFHTSLNHFLYLHFYIATKI